MKTSKKQREQENKILAQNALKSYKEKIIPFWHVMDGVDFIYDTNLQKKHNDEVINRVLENSTVIRLQEIVNNN